MDQSAPEQAKRTAFGDADIQQRITDRIIVSSAAFAVGAMLFAHLRAMRIGWGSRDVLQGTVVLAMVALAVARHRVSARLKAPLLVGVLILGGLSGFLTLGMLAGTVFVLPVALVVVALFYSTRTTVLFNVFVACICSLVAVSFCSGRQSVGADVAGLMAHPLHWAVYIGCLLLFSGIACTTILDYRKQIRALMDELRAQRDGLAAANAEIMAALADVKRLSGLIPICSSCKRIRDDDGYWEQIDCYIRDHSEANFSHGICPDCMRELYPDIAAEEDAAAAANERPGQS